MRGHRKIWSEGQVRQAPRQRSSSTRSGLWLSTTPRLQAPGRPDARPRDPRVLARSCPDFVAILARLETTLRIRARRAPYVATRITSPTSARTGRSLRSSRTPGPTSTPTAPTRRSRAASCACRRPRARTLSDALASGALAERCALGGAHARGVTLIPVAGVQAAVHAVEGRALALAVTALVLDLGP